MQVCSHVRPIKVVGVGLLPCVPQLLGLHAHRLCGLRSVHALHMMRVWDQSWCSVTVRNFWSGSHVSSLPSSLPLTRKRSDLRLVHMCPVPCHVCTCVSFIQVRGFWCTPAHCNLHRTNCTHLLNTQLPDIFITGRAAGSLLSLLLLASPLLLLLGCRLRPCRRPACILNPISLLHARDARTRHVYYPDGHHGKLDMRSRLASKRFGRPSACAEP